MPTVSEIMRYRPSESTHWYKRGTGKPCYTVTKKDGTERPYTLRDAKKYGDTCPSFSEIEKTYNKQALNMWITKQHILSAITLPRIAGETDAELMERIYADARAQQDKAAERGTQIHAWVQAGFECELDSEEGMQYFRVAHKAIYGKLTELGLPISQFRCEKSFAAEWEDRNVSVNGNWKSYYYGGKCDLHTDMVLIDFKTTEKPIDTCCLYDNHFRQLAAYKYGLIQNGYLSRDAVCGICFVNSVTPEARLVIANNDDIERGWGMFRGNLISWYAEKGL